MLDAGDSAVLSGGVSGENQMNRAVGASLKWPLDCVGVVWGNPGSRFEEILSHWKDIRHQFPRISGIKAGVSRDTEGIHQLRVEVDPMTINL
jgi:hypothetical protein